jgi:hypothetical protein
VRIPLAACLVLSAASLSLSAKRSSPSTSCWVPRAGCLVLGASCWVPRAGCLVLGASCWVPRAGCGVQSTRHPALPVVNSEPGTRRQVGCSTKRQACIRFRAFSSSQYKKAVNVGRRPAPNRTSGALRGMSCWNWTCRVSLYHPFSPRATNLISAGCELTSHLSKIRFRWVFAVLREIPSSVAAPSSVIPSNKRSQRHASVLVRL